MADDLFPLQTSHFIVLLAPLGVNTHDDFNTNASTDDGDGVTGWKASPAIQRVQGLQLPETTYRNVGDSINNKIVPMPSQIRGQQEITLVSNVRVTPSNTYIEGSDSSNFSEYKSGTMQDWLDWYESGTGVNTSAEYVSWTKARRAGRIYLLNFGKVVMQFSFVDGVLNAPQFSDLDAVNEDENFQVTCRISCVMENTGGRIGVSLPEIVKVT